MFEDVINYLLHITVEVEYAPTCSCVVQCVPFLHEHHNVASFLPLALAKNFKKPSVLPSMLVRCEKHHQEVLEDHKTTLVTLQCHVATLDLHCT